jgi:hypothetical protein
VKTLCRVLALAAILCPHMSRAQGCSQCRDTIAATAPHTQAAYRRAILLLCLCGGGVFVASTLALGRFRSHPFVAETEEDVDLSNRQA